MRSLNATLLAQQKAMGDVLCKIVLTFTATARVNSTDYVIGDRVRPATANGRNYICTTAGTSHTSEPVWPTTAGDTVTETSSTLVWTDNGLVSQTYGVDTTNRILNLAHSEEEFSQTAQILIDNRDKNLTALNLHGYSAVVSYGYHTTSDEYSPTAPLEVIAQKADSLFSPSDLVTAISLAGIFNMMSEDHASVAYNPESTNTDTVKTILTAIANKTMPCFSHCKSYTITFEPVSSSYPLGYDDDIINSYKPADYFNVGFNESRLSAFKKALSYTKCKARVGDDGTIHIFNPVVSGTTYDYEYNDAILATNHNFFDKSVRTRLVIPSKITVSSYPDQGSYTGNATDNDSYTALGRYIEEFHYIRPTSSAQCTAIATAQMQNLQMAAEKGHGIAPMNVGQEVFDYVKITDSKANDTRVGNIGYLNRTYRPGTFIFEFRFGSLFATGLAGTMSPSIAEGQVSMQALIDAYYSLSKDVIANRKTIIAILNYLNTGEMTLRKLRVTEQLIIPKWDVI